MNNLVLDMNGIEIKVGCVVRVHQEEEISTATVVELTNSLTSKSGHYWVDIDKGSGGIEGMMSYLLEVI